MQNYFKNYRFQIRTTDKYASSAASLIVKKLSSKPAKIKFSDNC